MTEATSADSAVLAPLSDKDPGFLRDAADYLENPSFLLRVANLLGKPIDVLRQALPDKVREGAENVVGGALNKTLKVALLTLPGAKDPRAIEEVLDERGWGHNAAAGVTGAVGGVFGLAALAVELPITTTIILRDIAGVAQSLGEDLADPETRLQCLAVFSLAGPNQAREGGLSALESSYYTSRVALGGTVREAAVYAASVTAEQLARDLAAGSSPAPGGGSKAGGPGRAGDWRGGRRAGQRGVRRAL
jgi:hypothetical protein